MEMSSDTAETVNHPNALLKVFQRRFQIHPDQLENSEQQQQQQQLQDKEFKLVILSTLNQIIDETMKKIMSGDYDSN